MIIKPKPYDELFAGTADETKEFLSSDRIGRYTIINHVYDANTRNVIFSVGIYYKSKEEKLKELSQERKGLKKRLKNIDKKIERLKKK